MRVVVTGGCGFIGASVVRALVDRGDLVLNIDRRRKSSPVQALQPIASSELHVRLEANIADRSLIRGVIREFKPDSVIHLAAGSGVESDQLYDSDVAGAFAVLEACRDLIPRMESDKARADFRIVCASPASSGTEETPPPGPAQASRLTGAALVRNWAQGFDLPLVECVADEVFGPWQAEEALVPRLSAAILSGEPFTLAHAGETVHDFLPVRDFAAGLVRACSSPKRQARYEFTVGAERREIDIVEAMCALLDQRAARPDGMSWSQGVQLEGRPPRGSLGPLLDPTGAERVLGWGGSGFHEGLNRTLAWALMRRQPTPPEQRAAE